MSKPYQSCQFCGAHLDHGEHCTCQRKQGTGANAEETKKDEKKPSAK